MMRYWFRLYETFRTLARRGQPNEAFATVEALTGVAAIEQILLVGVAAWVRALGGPEVISRLSKLEAVVTYIAILIGSWVLLHSKAVSKIRQQLEGRPRAERELASWVPLVWFVGAFAFLLAGAYVGGRRYRGQL